MEKKTLPQTRLQGSSVHEIAMDKEEEIKTKEIRREGMMNSRAEINGVRKQKKEKIVES